MKQNNKTILSAIVLSGVIGFVAGPTWSQWSQDPPKHQGSLDTGASEPSGEAFAGYDQETISDFQQALKDKGHDPGAIDGIMGPNTRQALREFQKQNNLKVTGVPNEQTAERLGVSLNGSKAGANIQSRESSGEASESKRQGSLDTFNQKEQK